MCDQKIFMASLRSSTCAFFLFFWLRMIAFSASTFAQQTTIVGTVTDPFRCRRPECGCHCDQVDTRVNRTFPTNDSGQYAAADLADRPLRGQGRSQRDSRLAEQKNIVLNVGARIRVDFQMQLGAAQETVTVEANAVQVQTDSGERSNLITGQQMTQIAVAGRSIYQLAASDSWSLEPDWRRWHEFR